MRLETRAPGSSRGSAPAAQVFENLVSNAIKFTPGRRGGAVRVTREADFALVSVADTGMGIPPQDRGRLFERMFRAREAERRHIQGTGLGLTIVKAIVDAHGGRSPSPARSSGAPPSASMLPVEAGGGPTDRRAPARTARHGPFEREAVRPKD